LTASEKTRSESLVSLVLWKSSSKNLRWCRFFKVDEIYWIFVFKSKFCKISPRDLKEANCSKHSKGWKSCIGLLVRSSLRASMLARELIPSQRYFKPLLLSLLFDNNNSIFWRNKNLLNTYEIYLASKSSNISLLRSRWRYSSWFSSESALLSVTC